MKTRKISAGFSLFSIALGASACMASHENQDEFDELVEVDAQELGALTGSRTPCNQDSACPSDEYCRFLDGGLCTTARGSGEVCTRNAQCLSDSCTSGLCSDGGSSSNECPYLLAYDSDGNIFDYDDIHATAMTLALIARAGMQKCLVHFSYNTNLSGNTTQAADQRRNVAEAVSRYGYDSSKFFDLNGTKGSAYTSGKANFGSAVAGLGNKKLVFILAGPMQVPYDYISSVPAASRSKITVLSHSVWNDQFARGPSMNACWDSSSCTCAKNGNIQYQASCSGTEASNRVYLSGLGVSMHHINDQNPPAFNSSAAEWSWLRSVDSDGWLYGAVTKGPKSGDASDAGMTHYVLTRGVPSGSRGTHSPTMPQVRTFFGK